MKYLKLISIMALFTFASGCADVDNAVFITKTSLGFDFSSAPPTVSIGYNRKEGYLGPKYKNGTAPPIVSVFKSDGTIFDPQIKQVYATGRASEIATKVRTDISLEPLTGGKDLMFFGTTSDIGLGVTFTAGAPGNLIFGYKRQELSVIPITTTDDEVHHSASVLASIEMNTDATSPEKLGLQNIQFFATGTAAEKLAGTKKIQDFFQDKAEEAISTYYKNSREQSSLLSYLLACYQRLEDKEDHIKVWNDAERLELISASVRDKIVSDAASGMPKDIRKSSHKYASDLAAKSDPNKVGLTGFIKAHKKFVCDIEKKIIISERKL